MPRLFYIAHTFFYSNFMSWIYLAMAFISFLFFINSQRFDSPKNVKFAKIRKSVRFFYVYCVFLRLTAFALAPSK